MIFPPLGVQGLYAIADFDAALGRGLDPFLVLQAMMDAAVPIIQLRAKSISDGEYLRWIERSVSRCPKGVRLVINDRVDLALLAAAGAVHLGQDDLPLDAVAQIAPHLCVGQSTHDLGQLRAGIASLPSYLAWGPVFTTASKANADPVTGLALLAQAHELTRTAGIPLVAIGGITEDSLAQVVPHCELIAAISLLLPVPGTALPYAWITERCAFIHARIIDLKRISGI